MIDYKYFKEHYKMESLPIDADISQDAVQQALIQLKFDFNHKYTLIIHPNDLHDIYNIIQGPIELKLELQENLPLDSWYLVDHTNKQIIYSVGA